jgi:hypothetical protein
VQIEPGFEARAHALFDEGDAEMIGEGATQGRLADAGAAAKGDAG